jgi:ubiquinone/menaquinone biosynthesis C-methylase UbiE
MDLTDIQFTDQAFDFIFCSHVLEHVPDDRQAMREMNRVLKRDGWAVMQVPLSREITYEDWSIVKPQERLKAFGQDDHVRRYGHDFEDRLRDTGFHVTRSTVSDVAQPNEAIRLGLTSASGDIFFCTKQ